MTDLKFDKEDAMELFGLENSDVQKIHYENANGDAQIKIELVPHYEPCPECGYERPKIKDYRWKRITHSVLTDRKCTLLYHARRYICPFCHHTYMEKNPFVFGSMSVSTFTVKNVLEDLKDYNETFSSVARRYHISPTTAAYIFDDHVQLPRKQLPEILCFDEVYAFRNYSEKFVCVLLDFRTHKPIDFLNSRRQDKLIRYFMKIPAEERKKVRVCSFDMYPTYRNVMKHCFVNSVGCIDHFHLCQELGRQVDKIRIRVMKGTKKVSDNYYLLKNFNWMLYRHSDINAPDGKPLFDPDRKAKYNWHFKYYINIDQRFI
jgi:transposase